MNQQDVQAALRAQLEEFYPRLYQYIRTNYPWTPNAQDGFQRGLMEFLEEGWDPSKASFEEAVLAKVERSIWRMFWWDKSRRQRWKRASFGEVERVATVDPTHDLEVKLSIDTYKKYLTKKQRALLEAYLYGHGRKDLAKATRAPHGLSYMFRRMINRLQRLEGQCITHTNKYGKWLDDKTDRSIRAGRRWKRTTETPERT